MPRTYVTAQERRFIAERARGRCEYCQSPVDFATQSFSVEHIFPISRGGETDLNNLALACPGCNGHNKPHDYPRRVSDRQTKSPRGSRRALP